MWYIYKVISKGEYLYALVPDHPYATDNGYVLYHRIVMEDHLGQLLGPNEVVHHIDEDHKNNKIKNLQVMTHEEHSAYHQRAKGIAMTELKCPYCKKNFVRRTLQTLLVKKDRIFTSCSPRCRGKFSRIIQLNGYIPWVTDAMEENIIREYRLYPEGL